MILKKTLVDFDNVVVFGFCNIFSASFLLPLGYQRVNTNSIGGTIGKNLKNHHFSEKKGHLWFHPMELLFFLWYPKGSKKNWPKCLRPIVTLDKVSRPKCVRPKCHSFPLKSVGFPCDSYCPF